MWRFSADPKAYFQKPTARHLATQPARFDRILSQRILLKILNLLLGRLSLWRSLSPTTLTLAIQE